MLKNKVKLQVWALTLLVFLIGGASGVALDRLYFINKFPPPNRHIDRRAKFLNELKEALNLTDEQVAKVHSAYEEARKEFDPKKFDNCPSYIEARNKTRERVKAVLTPEQQIKYDKFMEERDKKK